MAACTRGQLGLGTPHGARAPRDSSVDRYAVVSFFHTKDDPDDCAWLRDNRDRIEAWEKRLRT
jgi:hypothetical protein